jgi:hypothetical protein
MRTFTVDADVTVDMRGATLAPHTGGGNDGPVLDIRNTRAVTLLGGTILGSNNGDGILCNGTLTVDGTNITMTDKSGINAMGSCNLAVTHATITGASKGGGGLVAAIATTGSLLTLSRSTLQDNRGGGLTIGGGKFIVIGNVFLNNGGDPSTIGGISISAVADLTSRLEFNTVIGNTITDGARTSGIDCIGTINAIGRNNIVWNNKQKTIGTGIQQISGLCKHAYSNIGPSGVLTANDGMNNFNDDPKVMSEQNDLRLKTGSPDIGHADPAADLTGVAAKDIDGMDRKPPAGMNADIGAYRYKAP